MVDQITLRQPDDWHLHLRDGELLKAVVGFSARVFRRGIVMPNLKTPITTLQDAENYKKRIVESIPSDLSFTPLMTAYLTDKLSPDVLRIGYSEGIFQAAKLYPVNSTTNSADGVSDLNRINSIFEIMERIGMPLLIHGEVNDLEIDVFDREAVFIERYLDPLIRRFEGLKVVLEHITTKDAVDFVRSSSSNLAATITPHHLHINRNAMFLGGLRSDFYCLPVAKREKHRLALRSAAISGESCFFLGTDSAPHSRENKETACACAGIFNAPFALESYTEVFDQEGALDRLEAFASEYGPAFYGLPLNEGKITLIRRKVTVPEKLDLANNSLLETSLVPFHSGETLNWSIEN